jgi:hypothetical protein
MTGEVIALLLTVVVHILGALVLIGVIAKNSGADPFSWWPRDDEGPGGTDLDHRPNAPEPGDGGLPMPGAGPAPVRLRQPDRLADAYGRPARRPVHPEPARAPVPEPQR